MEVVVGVAAGAAARAAATEVAAGAAAEVVEVAAATVWFIACKGFAKNYQYYLFLFPYI